MQTIKHQAWPDIGQFRNLIRAVKEKATFSHLDSNGDAVFDNCKPLPTLKFQGTVKLHGTNACLIIDSKQNLYFQSRERMITVQDDNAGFCRFFTDLKTSGVNLWEMVNAETLLKKISDDEEEPSDCTIRIYGEWAGGNIQKGVALNKLQKMFVIFGVKVGNLWMTPDEVASFPAMPQHNIFNVYSAPTYELTVDFNKPEIAQDQIVKLVEEVEKLCPWGAKFGVEGIGEGLVWRCVTPGWESTSYYMKTKGEKHSVSRVKTVASVDVEKVASERAFCEMAVSDARCTQMIQKVKESGVKVVDRTQMGVFLRYLYNDCVKEESDVAVGSGLDISKLGGMISTYGKQWFFKNEDKFDEL